MPEGTLRTTNLLLEIMAAVSVLQAVVLVVVGILAFRMYRKAMQAIHDIEQRQIAPLRTQLSGLITRVDAIVDDVRDVTGRVTRQTERVDSAINHTLHRVDATVWRVRESIGPRMWRLIGLARGVAYAVQDLVNSRRASSAT
jgi:hypothetical protein